MRRAAQRATAAVRLLRIGLSVLRGGCVGGVRTDGAGQRIGRSVADSPAGSDRCENLHQHRKHDDWKKSSQSPSHDCPAFHFASYHAQSRESRLGSRIFEGRAANVAFAAHCRRRMSLPPLVAKKPRQKSRITQRTDCSARNMKFELLFQKVVTKQKRWATNLSAGGLRVTSGGPSLGRSPGAHKRCHPVNQRQI